MTSSFEYINSLTSIADRLRDIVSATKNSADKTLLSALNDVEKELELLNTSINEDTLLTEFSIDSVLFNQLGYFWIKDINSKFITVNKAFAELCGFNDPKLLKDKTDFDIWPADIAEQYINDDKLIINTGKPHLTEEKMKLNEGEKWLETYKVPVFNRKHEIIGISGYSRDITTRKKALETVKKLSLAVEQSPVSVVITDTTGNIEYVNPKFYEISKYTESEVIGHNPRILKSGQTKDNAYKNLWHTITSGDVWHGNFCNKNAKGELYWEAVTISPIRNDKGVITNFVAIKEDITELKKKNQDIMNISQQLHTVTENISEVFCLLDKKCKEILYISPAFEKITGVSSHKIINDLSTLYDIVIEEDRKYLFTKYLHLLKYKKFDVEFRIKHSDSKIRWIHARIYPVKNSKGIIQQFAGIAIDITKQKLTEEILRKSEEKYRLITESSSDVIWVYNINSNSFTYISSAIYALRGMSVKEAMKEKLTDSLSPDSIKTMNKLVSRNAQKIFTVERNESSYSIDEIQQKHKDGQLIWVEVSSMLQYNQNGESELIGISRDITKRKETEKELENLNKLQDVLVNMSLSYISMEYSDISGNVSKSLHDLSKLISAERAMIFSYDWENDYCQCDYEWYDDTLSSIKENLMNIPLNNMPEWINKHKNGEIYEIQKLEEFFGYARPEMETNGVKSMISIPLMLNNQPIGFIIFDSIFNYHNYTDKEKTLLTIFGQLYVNLLQRKKLETGLIQEKENALTANKAKSEFLANMSHELRTPLNGVIGFSELLYQTNLTDVQKNYAKAINTSAHSLLGVITDILDFSKIEANKLELEIVKTDIEELINQTIEVVSPAAEKKNLELLLNVDPLLPKYVFTDPIRLSQVLANLLSNAIKFTSDGEVELKVSFQKIADNKGNITFAVRDTGIGISDEQKNKLFKAFSQADSSTTRKFGGTGLGLIISDLIAHKMGSDIKLESEKNKGTNFYFTIETNIEYSNEELKFPIISGKVLIIDDNKQSASNISKLLRHINIASEYCENAQEAIMLLRLSNDFDIIFIDNQIYNMTGTESVQLICDKLGIQTSDKEFIIMHSTTEDYLFYEECNEIGIKHLMAKPFKLSQLIENLNDIHSGIDTKTKEVYQESFMSEQGNKIFKILIADDDIFNMMLAKAMIQNLLPNAVLVEAKTGIEAYQAFIRNRIDIVFMDVQMPEMDGNDATKAIRTFEKQKGKHIPVVGLTAGALTEEREKCLEAGMDEFLTKPIDSDKLKNIIKKFLYKEPSENE